MTERPKSTDTIYTYIAVVREAWDTFGLPTLLLAVILSLWIGWLPSPLSEAKETLTRLKTVTEVHTSHDEELLFYLKQVCLANVKMAHLPYESCTWWPGRSPTPNQ